MIIIHKKNKHNAYNFNVDRKVKFSTKEETRFKQHMNLPGTANMTYDFVKGFFDDYKKLMSKIIRRRYCILFKSLPKIKFMRLWFMQDSMEVS